MTEVGGFSTYQERKKNCKYCKYGKAFRYEKWKKKIDYYCKLKGSLIVNGKCESKIARELNEQERS